LLAGLKFAFLFRTKKGKKAKWLEAYYFIGATAWHADCKTHGARKTRPRSTFYPYTCGGKIAGYLLEGNIWGFGYAEFNVGSMSPQETAVDVRNG